MTGLPRLASLAAVSALLLTATSLACKPTGTAPPAVASAPTAKCDPPARTDPWAKPFIPYTRACSPGDAEASVCTAEQPPVCGQKSDLTRATFADSCAACRDPKVVYYTPGACREEPPA
jgi:sugar/nucleoside kinase (ribokinase family)